VTWRDIAASNGRLYHPLMQYGQIRQSDSLPLEPPAISQPEEGYLFPELCHALYSALAAWTSTPETIWLGIWEGYGSLYAPSGGAVALLARSVKLRPWRRRRGKDDLDAGRTRLIASWEEAAKAIRHAPRFEHPGRSYLLAKSPCTSVCELGGSPFRVTPNLAWPDDRAWCVGTEIDFDSTVVAASEACAASLLANEALETLEVAPGDSLDFGGDILNPPVDR
jgi:hypothetical protein